ncbi:MAG: hypothetical protein RBU37_12815 [Myxococcota bacterium]|jgi:hypothetical protein|nr:hypothetical protein [Myxococcota bacterium]
MKRLSLMLLLLALLALPTSLFAQEGAAAAVGKIGVGYTHTNAPLGIRMWFSDQFGFDVGAGLVLHGNEDDHEDPGDDTTTVDFALDGGFLIALQRSTNSIFFARIGLNFDRRYADGFENDGEPVYSSQETLSIAGMAGIELFMTALGFPNLSLQGAVGVGLQYVVGPQRVGDEENDWSFGSMTTGVSLVGTTQLGFHYYF